MVAVLNIVYKSKGSSRKTSLEAPTLSEVRNEGNLNMSGPGGDSSSMEKGLLGDIFCISKQHIFMTD